MRVTRSSRCTRHAFTLAELGVSIVAVGALVAVSLPTLGHARGIDRTEESQAKMRALGTASAQYGADNADAIFSFSTSDNAAKSELLDTMSLLTGRPTEGGEPHVLRRLDNVTPRRRYSHVLLFQYLDARLPEPLAASPFDRNLLGWQQDPIYAQDNTVPYAKSNGESGSDRSENWTNTDVRQMWPYGSSYQVSTSAWNVNNSSEGNPWSPIDSTPNLFNVGAAAKRAYAEVAFPAGKVHMFEEFDGLWHKEALWFAYPEARCNLLFFDGSVRRLLSRDSNPGWNPRQPNSLWEQRYYPFDTFPWYHPSYASRTEFKMRYRWTREGLGGIDYGGREVNVPPAVRDHPDYRTEPEERFGPRYKEQNASPIDEP